MLRDSLSQGATRAKLANHHKKNKKQRATLMTKWLITAHYKSVRVCAGVSSHLLHIEYPNPHSTIKVGPYNFRELFEG